jgi:undecaprenyl-phosphate galactose phosphotransferase/putative colanic acid biosynthesis UDP-glucose lipid carrier transferase
MAYQGFAPTGPLVAVGLNSAVIFTLFANSRSLYRPEQLVLGSKQFRSIVFCWFVTLLVLGALLFLFKISEQYSRGAMIGFAVIGLVLLLISRFVLAAGVRQALSQGTLAGPRSIVIGIADELAQVSTGDLLEKYGTREIGRFALSGNPGSDTTLSGGDYEMIDRAIEFAQVNRAEKVLLSLPWSDVRLHDLVSERLRALPLQVLLLPDQIATSVLSRPIRQSGSRLALEVSRAPLSSTELALKRTLDLAVAGLAVVLLLPLFVLVSLAIKLDSRGPVLFRQKRMGFNGRMFTIFKFRSMRVLENGPAIRQATRNDDRVTRVGRMLRASSIDELPQLINVLRGDMSLVGPRPHALAHDTEYGDSIADYAFRHHVKPGITGWAQVNGLRGETARVELMIKRVEYDLWYIHNWSIWLDLWTLARTCLEVLRRQNAY